MTTHEIGQCVEFLGSPGRRFSFTIEWKLWLVALPWKQVGIRRGDDETFLEGSVREARIHL